MASATGATKIMQNMNIITMHRLSPSLNGLTAIEAPMETSFTWGLQPLFFGLLGTRK